MTGAAPIAYAANPLGYAAAPIAYAGAPAIATYAAAPASVVVPAPVTYSTGVKVAHVYEPVEQHGYKIAY